MGVLLFVGGTRCGKSSLALRWAEAQAGSRLFLATCVPEDAEMAARVDRHRIGRGPAWECLEEGLDPQKALEAHFSPPEAGGPGVMLLDCVSMWVANMLYAGMSLDDALSRMDLFLEYLAGLGLPAALVSAEAGLGIVPANPVGRRFQDALGLANQRLARVCRTVILVSCGLPLPLKGALPEGLC